MSNRSMIENAIENPSLQLKIKDYRTVRVPCQSCGTLVEVIAPFIGCAFCESCRKSQTGQRTNGSENTQGREY